MKKFISLLICSLLLLPLFCGCGESPVLDAQKEKSLLDKNNPVTLTMWHVYGEQADSPMNLIVKEFNDTVGEEKGIVIKVTNVSSSSKINSQLYDSQDGKAGALEMPEIFSCHTATAMTLGPDKLVDFNKYYSAEELSDYVPAFIEDGTTDGRLVVFPVSKSTYALYVNGSQFDRFSNDTGVTYESLSTWEVNSTLKTR